MKVHIPLAKKACEFLTASPDPFHAVKNSVTKLEAAGFQALRKRQPFHLSPGGKYYYTINHSTLVAFTVGALYKPGNGFVIIGGHTDSPNLKVKPISKKSANDCVLLGVECYGGGLWHTWFDRDLGVSGRVLVRKKSNGGIEQRLVNLATPIARVSSLCIHLQTAEERKAFAVSKETHMSPILGTQAVLEKGAEEQLNASTTDLEKRHQPELLQAIAKQLDVDVSDIADLELNLYDVQPASLGGLASEFLYSARLDNLATVFCSIEALVEHSKDLSNDTDVSLVALFDHEEIGSQSAHGAGSPVMAEAVKRISSALGADNPDIYAACIRNSFVLSCDQAHAVHPNYASKHESTHAPKLNGGVVIKTNANQRYTTNGVTGFVVRELGRNAGVEVQEFVVRNDCPCGSTIGPIISANTGIRTVDIGMPQLSMHSCREVMGIADLTNGVELFKAYFNGFRALDDQLEG